MYVKVEVDGLMLDMSGFAPQFGCEVEEKEEFWKDLNKYMESFPREEGVVIEADLNGRVGEEFRDEEVMRKRIKKDRL